MTGALTFEPAQATIRAGDVVSWTNPSSMVHTVTGDPSLANDPAHVLLPEGAEPFRSGDIPPGGEYRRAFPVAGRYRYFCVPHERMGMIGELVVQPAASDG